jgi:glycine/D-amino acid oxidase-like deaminating enzyme
MLDLRHGYPYSLVRNGLPFDYPKLTSNTGTEVLVAGGGISGALSAWYLCKAGIPCIVTDARTAGLGSTCTSTSLVQYELDMPLVKLAKVTGTEQASRIYRLCVESIGKLTSIAAELRFSEYHRKRSVYFAEEAGHVKFLEAELKARQQAGIDVEWVDKKGLQHRYGFVRPGAIVSADAATMDAYLFTHALHQYNLDHGCRVYDRTQIVATKPGRTGIKATTREGHTIQARYMIDATGYEAERKLGRKYVHLHSTFAFATEQQEREKADPLDDAVFWNTANPYLYFRKSNDCRIIAGGRDEMFYSPTRRDGLLKHKTKLLAADIQALLSGYTIKPEFSWAGTFGVTKDSLPFVGSHPSFKRMLFALGFGGNGIVFSQIAAEMNASWFTGYPHPQMDLFSFSRIR